LLLLSLMPVSVGSYKSPTLTDLRLEALQSGHTRLTKLALSSRLHQVDDSIKLID
jgi:hypothetical protein